MQLVLAPEPDQQLQEPKLFQEAHVKLWKLRMEQECREQRKGIQKLEIQRFRFN